MVAILSFVPGLGQLINGDIKKGAVMFLLAVVLGSVTFGLGWIAVVIWSMVDAYKVAAGTGKRW